MTHHHARHIRSPTRDIPSCDDAAVRVLSDVSASTASLSRTGVERNRVPKMHAGIAADHLRETSGQSAYVDQATAVAAAFNSEATAKRSSSPEVIAKTVDKAAGARRPKTRYAVGSGAKPLILMRRWLPDRAYDAVIRRVGGMR